MSAANVLGSNTSRFNNRLLGLIGCFTLLAQANAASASYVSTVLSDAPLGYWRLGESAGAVANDAGPNHFDGTYVGAVTLGQPGAIRTTTDTGIFLDGQSGFVNVGSHTALNQLTNNFTLEAWVKGKGPIISTWLDAAPGQQTSGFGLSIPVDPGLGTDSTYPSVLRFTTFGIKDYDFPMDFPSQTWFHIAVVFDASNDVTFYVNGGAVATIAGALPARTNSQPLHIGEAADGTFHFAGSIDEVAIYDRSLSAEQIQQHFLAATVSLPSPLLSTLSLAFLAGLGTVLRRTVRREKACLFGKSK